MTTDTLVIAPEDPRSAHARDLIALSEAELSAAYPPDQRFALDVEALVARGVRFALARLDGRPVGCGGIEIAGDAAELKRMFVAPEVRGRGVGMALLAFLEAEARRQGIRRLVLETGDAQAAALALYARAGFVRVPCWGAYAASPSSICMAKDL